MNRGCTTFVGEGGCGELGLQQGFLRPHIIHLSLNLFVPSGFYNKIANI